MNNEFKDLNKYIGKDVRVSYVIGTEGLTEEDICRRVNGVIKTISKDILTLQNPITKTEITINQPNIFYVREKGYFNWNKILWLNQNKVIKRKNGIEQLWKNYQVVSWFYFGIFVAGMFFLYLYARSYQPAILLTQNSTISDFLIDIVPILKIGGALLILLFGLISIDFGYALIADDPNRFYIRLLELKANIE